MDCVAIAKLADNLVGVGDSKNAGNPALISTPDEWAAFTTGVQTGEFDLPARPSAADALTPSRANAREQRLVTVAQVDGSMRSDPLADALRAASAGARLSMVGALVTAARSDDGGAVLTSVTQEALGAGMDRDAIMRACNAARLEIRTNAGAANDYSDPAEDRLLELMDRLVGWQPGRQV